MPTFSSYVPTAADVFNPNWIDPRPRGPSPPLPSGAPFADIVKFFNDKARRNGPNVPLTEGEVLTLTEQLKQNATEGAREMLDSISLSVPSAALMSEYGRRAGATSATPSHTNGDSTFGGTTFGSPLRSPFFDSDTRSYGPPTQHSTMGTPARRRRNVYAGVGQSPARATTTPRARAPVTPASRLKLERSSGEGVSGSNKKRLVGDGGIPFASGPSFGSTSNQEDGSAPSSKSSSFTSSFESTQNSQNSQVSSSTTFTSTSSVPFPLVSPTKPLTSATLASTSTGPFSRPVNAPTRRGGHTMPAPVPVIPRPEAPKHPSPLRHVNLADMSSSSESSSRNGTPERVLPSPKPNGARSSASTTILDVVMDSANTLPPAKSKTREENPFDELMPAPRVSTPVRRVSQRFPSKKSGGASHESPATASTTILNNGVPRSPLSFLDQIDATAPKPVRSHSPQRYDSCSLTTQPVHPCPAPKVKYRAIRDLTRLVVLAVFCSHANAYHLFQH